MFSKIAGFELRYQLRQPVFWVTAIIFFLLTFGATTVDQIRIGVGGNVHKNSPFELAMISLIMTIFYMFVTTSFVANVIVRDDETGFAPILRTTRISKFDYLGGRFTGAFLVAAIGFIAIPFGVFCGSFMPWVDSETLGPNRLGDYAFAYLVMGVPNVLITSAIFFAVATMTRSMMWTYVSVLGFLILYIVLNASLARKPELDHLRSYVEPFGIAAYSLTTRYWTAAERNTLTPPLAGALIANRVLWISAALALVALAHSAFRFEVRGAKLKKSQKLRALAEVAAPVAKARSSLPKPRFDAAGAWAQLVKRTRFEMGQVFRSPAFFVLMLLGVFNSVGQLWFTRELYGTSIYPVTRLSIQALKGAFSLVPIIISIYYAGELVWRERDRRTHEIIDASAAPDWTFVFPKVLALSLVLFATLIGSVIAAVAVQAAKGYDNFELGKYLLWYVIPSGIDWTLLAVLAIFLQAISPHKFIGWGLMVIFLIAQLTLTNLGFEDNLYQYGNGPGVPLSDMNGQGQFWKAADWFRVYWSAFACLLLILTYGLWRRGTETRLSPRLVRLPRRLRGAGGVAAALALLVFMGSGGFIWLNTHVWNSYRTDLDRERRLADMEKSLLRFEKAPEPTVTAIKLDVDLHPHESGLTADGVYDMENRSGVPITDVHLLTNTRARIMSLQLPGARLVRDERRFNFRIYRFDQPLAPGARVSMRFRTAITQHGFRNSGNLNRIVDNGTFVDNSAFTPSFGVDRGSFLKDRAKRRKYGLPPELRLPKLEDDTARARNYVGNAPWVMTDIRVTTDADQTPIAPGYKVSDSVANGRRTVEFKTDAPILAFFSIQSGRYAEKHVNYKGVDIGVYYDRQHPYNVDRMIRSAETGLDYYQANFSPYQFRQFRFIEFPDYAGFAQSFANTVPWSEGLGFVADVRDSTKIDYVTYVGAHELGHQWWAHQEISAEMQGGTMLVETLAQYSALMVMEKLYGPDQIRKFLKYELDTYLRARGGEAVEEVPLERVEDQPYIHYNKGALVMYLLKDQIGEEAVNRALRKFLATYAFKGAPYASSKDLVADFRAEAPADKQQLITDLFEKITLYDVKATRTEVKKRADGRYDVRLTVSARKVYADGRGREQPAAMSNESFDVGLFSAKPGEGAFNARDVILFQRVPLRTGVQTFDFVTTRAPKWGGVDPYNKRIDRNSDDNLIAASS